MQQLKLGDSSTAGPGPVPDRGAANNNNNGRSNTQVKHPESKLKADIQTLVSATSAIRDFKVNAKVSAENMPTSVQLQKNIRAQKDLFMYMESNWKNNPQIRVQLSQKSRLPK